MKVILREDVENLGKAGDVVKVAGGYGRNYLIPKRLAVQADVRNLQALEHERRGIEARAKKARKTAGLLNGMDTTTWNPEIDKLIAEKEKEVMTV